MLMIPAEREIDWLRPPWVTLALIALNIMVFFALQGRDERLMDEALAGYQQHDLVWLEAPAYAHWLEREASLNNRDTLGKAEAVRKAIQEKNEPWLAQVMLRDRAFYLMLQRDAGLYWQRPEVQRWQEIRPVLAELVYRHSSFQAGLLPAEIQLSDLVSYAFLHASLAYLAGNMLLLLLLGCPRERALGRFRFIVSYFLCGACAGLFHSLLNAESWVPLMGASGAVSGLMGMYLALFGLQKIRFLCFFGVYFKYVTAPALLMLPVWIAKEALDYWLGAPPKVAFWADAGGLLCGAGLMWLFRRHWLETGESVLAPLVEDQDGEFRERYAAAMHALGRFEFEQARVLFEALWRDYPTRLGLLEHLYHLHKLDPAQAACHRCAHELIAQSLRCNEVGLALRSYEDYLKRTGAQSQLEPSMHFQVLHAALRHNELKQAEACFARLQTVAAEELAREAAALLAQEFKRQQLEVKARKYLELSRP